MTKHACDPAPLLVRVATEDDAEALAEIYAPIVRDTAISFELVPPGADAFRAKVRALRGFAPFLVGEDDGRVVGYAYAASYRERPAYRFTVETTVYVRDGSRRRGVGRALYDALLRRLERQGFCTAVAAIALPNAASVALHEAVGFTMIGVSRGVGFKFGRWHDVGFWDRNLAPRVDDPPEPAAADL